MKSMLIICHENARNYLIKIAIKRYSNLNAEAINAVTSQKDFDKFSFTSKKPDLIWILVEIGWNELELKQGYNVALHLMQRPEYEKEVLNITFFSAKKRKTLLDQTSDEKNIFPKAFEHHQLPIQEFSQIQTLEINSNSYKFIKNYALSKSSILGDIIHRLIGVSISKDIFNDMIDVLKRLQSIRSILTPDIIDLMNSKFNTIKQVNALQEKLQALRMSLENENEDNIETDYKKIIRTVIIVEDNDSLGVIIKNWLLPFCNNVELVSDGEEAKESIVKNCNDLDLLLCDLELLDKNGFWQSTQGVGVLEFVGEKAPQTYKVVLSGLPTQAVKILVPEKSFINQHIRKKELFLSKTSMYETLYPVLEKSKKYSRRFIKSISGPNIKNLNLILNRYYDLKLSDDTSYKEEYKTLQEKINQFLNYYNGLPLPSNQEWSTEMYSTKSKDLPAVVWAKLPMILAMRKIIIQYVLKKNETIEARGEIVYYFNFTKFKSQSELFENFDKNFKTLMNTFLSFNVFKLQNNPGDESCYIFLKNLFVEEIIFIDSLKNYQSSEPIINYESFSKFKFFIEKLNEILEDDYFDYVDTVDVFTEKLEKLISKIKHEDDSQFIIRTLLDYYPYDTKSIPQKFEDLRNITEVLFTLDDE